MFGNATSETDPLTGSKPRGLGTRAILVILALILLPWLFFTTVFSMWSLGFYHTSPSTTMVVTGISLFFCACLAYYSIRVQRKRRRSGQVAVEHGYRRPYQEAPWAGYTSALFFTALVAATLLGDMNYYSNAKPYYDFEDLVAYINVNPAQERGQTYMDAGQVYFKEFSKVDKAHAIAYRNKELYCAAPIVWENIKGPGADGGDVPPPPDSGTMDFWAVGVNCCLPTGEEFTCGDANNVNARSGLRLLRDDQRAFFKLAVEEWAAQYKIPVAHPLFFHWTQDPRGAIDSYHISALGHFMQFTGIYFALNLFLVIALVTFEWNRAALAAANAARG